MLLAAPAARVVVPATTRAPLSVMAPLVVTVRPPLMVEAPRFRALMSLRVTLLPLTMLTVLKSLALSKVMLLAAPAARVVVQATTRARSEERRVGIESGRRRLLVDATRIRE